ncbi:hypothetical protein EST38_g1124 [Candolleomyces aberdarensis]|uniref:Transcription factor n=1 Tax=Candolleomyces aberdarensis TaxID=2316362 RepID=A0A4Q2DWV9_9AGAR|nr:hypothetical protein EST38_g1124 [Candolleomyces aberdarensis]
MDADDIFAAMGITGFGKAAPKRALDPNRFDKTKRDPKGDISKANSSAPSPGTSTPANIASRASPESSSEPGPQPPARQNQVGEEPEYDPSDDDDDLYETDFPTTHELVMKDHTKVVSALAMDPSGARVLSGSHDYDCKLWDFGGMSAECKPFKSWEPAGSYPINEVKFSSDGTKFLVIPATFQPRMYDRDGQELATFIKGDPYLRDMKNTSIWDSDNKRKQKTVIVVKSKDRGGRTKVTACSYSPDAALIGADGAIHLWQTQSNFVRPHRTIEGAHVKGSETGSLVFSLDGHTIMTRGGPGDDTLKLWDIRAFKKPIAVREGLPTLYPRTNAVFSPDERYIVTGCGPTGKGGSPSLVFLKKENLEVVKTLSVDSTPVIVLWHAKLNQIVAGLANGQIVVLYSPETSHNGAKLVMSKGPPRKITIEDMSDALSAPAILTPHALPMFRDMDPGRGTKRKREKDRMDPRKSRRPDLPVTGPGKGGRVGASATQHVVQNLVRDTTRDVDPREALLKYAEAAENDPKWTADPGHAPPNGVHAHAAINGDQPSELAAKPAIKLNGDAGYSALSPAADSPATPVSTAPAPDVKIDIDYPEQESDVRNEPVEIKPIVPVGHLQDMSVVSQTASHEIPIDDVQDTPPLPSSDDDDVSMAAHLHSNGLNGHHPNGDVVMSEEPEAAIAADASMASIDEVPSPNGSRERPSEGYDDYEQPPAKRARILSDADKASMTHSATPPPVSANVSNAASPAPPPPSTSAATATTMASTPTPTATSAFPTDSTFSIAQFKFCQSCIRSLKKLKDAVPFLKPVDTVALNIPHYNSIVKHPMDFSTIERKLNSSNPAKPDPNPQNPRYYNADGFVADVRLVFTNCLTFNGPDHIIVSMGKRVEEIFDKQMKTMPPALEPKPAPPPKKATPPPPPPPPPVVAPPQKKTAPVRRPSTSVPVIRRNDIPEPVGRPKREIHPPPPKDLPYADAPKKNRKSKRGDAPVNEQLKYCGKLLQEFHKKAHYNIAHPFYEPVDWLKMELPTYPKVVKRPMDLSTMRRKLENHDYLTAQQFYNDFKLMIKNCMLFNPIGTPVCTAGQELDRLFEEKWRSLPPLRPVQLSEDEDDGDDGEDSEAERQRAIAQMESQIETMRGNLELLKNASAKSKKDKKKKKERELPPAPSTSKPPPKQTKPAAAPTKKKSKKPIPDDDVLSFEQKKDLSETISQLEGAKLEKVINIIHEGVPEIRDSTEEIEIEIDTLPASVLTKLYNFVIRPTKQPAVKRNRPGKGSGTGGLKRKSMDEDVEAEKIRQLEQRMALFDQGATGAAPPPLPRHGEDSDSDSSSGSGSSDSDSD